MLKERFSKLIQHLVREIKSFYFRFKKHIFWYCKICEIGTLGNKILTNRINISLACIITSCKYLRRCRNFLTLMMFCGQGHFLYFLVYHFTSLYIGSSIHPSVRQWHVLFCLFFKFSKGVFRKLNLTFQFSNINDILARTCLIMWSRLTNTIRRWIRNKNSNDLKHPRQKCNTSFSKYNLLYLENTIRKLDN